MAVIEHSTELNEPVAWPKNPTSDAATDLVRPLELLLIDLGINPKPEDMLVQGSYQTAGNHVPPSVAIIEAGATEFSQKASRQLKWFGGGTATVGATVAYLTGYWNKASDGIRITTVAGVAFVLAAALIAVSLVVASDVRARGHAAAAQYGARAQIADAYLRGAGLALQLTAPGGSAPGPVASIGHQTNGEVAQTTEAAGA